MKLSKCKLTALFLLFFTGKAYAVEFTKEELELVKDACLAGSSFEFKTEADGSISVKNLEGKGKLVIGKKEVTTVDLPDADKKDEFKEIRSCIRAYLIDDKSVKPPKVEQDSSLSPPLGTNIFIGMSRDELKRQLPASASWKSNASGLMAFSNSTFLGIPGAVSISLDSDRIRKVTFSTNITGATWTTNYDNKESRQSKNGESRNHAEAEQECKPILSLQSDLSREFGMPSNIIRPETPYDPTVSVTKPKIVRVAQGKKWTQEYKAKTVAFVVDVNWFAWDYDVKDTYTVSTTKKNFACYLTVEFT